MTALLDVLTDTELASATAHLRVFVRLGNMRPDEVGRWQKRIAAVQPSRQHVAGTG